VDGPLPNATHDDRIDYAYDPLGRLTGATYQGIALPSSTTKASVSVTYNDAGEPIKVSVPLQTTVTQNRFYTYDGAGRKKTYRDARGTTTWTYNLAGWPTVVDDPRTTNVSLGYDTLGRLVCRHTASCTASTAGAERFAYDAAGNLTQAISISPAPTYTLAYDDDGRLLTVSRGAVVETTYTYQASTGLLTQVADPAGVTAYTYDLAGRVATLDDPLTTGTARSTYAYDPASGRLTTRTDSQANLRWELSYEAPTGRLDTQTIRNDATSATLASFDLSYDLAGNVTSKATDVFANPSDGTWSYGYDGASRLVQATGPNATGALTTWHYAYDGGGNRIGAKETTGSVVANWSTTYDAAGLPTSATNAVGGETVTYTHDPVGSLTKADSTVASNDWAYTYDHLSRLTCAKQATGCSSGTTRVQFTLDAFDRTYQRTYSGAVTDHWYRGISEQPVKSQVGAGTPTLYAYTPGGSPLGEKTSAAWYYLRDPHGDVVGLTTTGAQNQGTTAYDPWGKPLGTTGTQGWFGYQSDPTDPVTKQVDMGTRWYSPGMGRFSSRDVLEGDPAAPMTLNRFVYGQMNPVTLSDPTGMCPRDRCPWLFDDRGVEIEDVGRGIRDWESHRPVVVPDPAQAPPIVYDPNNFNLPSCVRTDCGDALAGLPDGTVICRTGMMDCPDYVGENYWVGTKGLSYRFAGRPPTVSHWQTLGALVATTCAAASGGVATGPCLGATIGLFGAKEAAITYRAFEGPGGFRWRQWAADSSFNVATTVPGIPRVVGPVFSAACSTSETCSGPGAPDWWPGSDRA
jgi:RHS repeat-associated protein